MWVRRGDGETIESENLSPALHVHDRDNCFHIMPHHRLAFGSVRAWVSVGMGMGMGMGVGVNVSVSMRV